jgi:CRP/FNR family cyclic AMP-dependent transcriptional regulator
VRLTRGGKVDLIRGIPLFSECSRAELEAVARVTDELRFPEGRMLMRQGARGRELVVIVEGDVSIEQDGKRIAVRSGGDFLGELALVTGRPRTATVTALTELRALVLDGLSFDRLLRDVPTIAVKIMRAVAERLPSDEP